MRKVSAIHADKNQGSAKNKGFVSRLRDVALKSLERMYLPGEKLFAFCVRKTGNGIVTEGVSRRYTAIALIGLAGEYRKSSGSPLFDGQKLHALCERLNENIASVDNLGDVALALWAARAVGYPDRKEMRERLSEFKPADGHYPVVEISWALDALCIGAEAQAGDLGERLAQRLLSSFDAKSAMFPHVMGSSGMRAHVSCFADMIYPIHALSNYSRVSGDKNALDAATKCAEKICRLQGADGQWWWHYDRRTGNVIEGYPVYSVHQDAMAPMALFALKDAGGPDFSSELRKGLDWLEYSPEINASLVDDTADVIWRKVARREPGKFSRYANAVTSRLHPALRLPGVDALFPPVAVDWESRPYHMGWLLYAWPKERAVKWDDG